jgi:hypothetical protein
MPTIQEIRIEIEQLILDAFRETIIENSLVDTGFLRDSATVEIDNDFNITISAADYYKFLDEGTKFIRPYDLTEEILEHPSFKRAEELLEEYILLKIESVLTNEQE